MKTKLTAAVLGLGMLGVADLAIADNFGASFTGFQAVPTLSLPGSTAQATFQVNNTDSAINYTLTYNINPADPAICPAGVSNPPNGCVQQVHVHFGRPRTNGGVVAFLCYNTGTTAPPAGTPLCPNAPGPNTVTGTLTANEIVGPSVQGIGPTQLAEVLAALRRNGPSNLYGCVHTDGFPGGSIRGALTRGQGNNDD